MTRQGVSTQSFTRSSMSVRDEVGVMAMVNKRDLVIDHSYQRNENQRKVSAIAKEWSWIAFGAIIVADRDGILYVIDGQHRVLASLLRPDVTDIPCIIFKTNEAKEEAVGFLAAQTQRRPVSAKEKFKAMIVTEDKSALIVDDLLISCGRSATGKSSASSVMCIQVLLETAKKNPQLLKEVWPLVAEICRGKPIGKKLVLGLLYIAKRMPNGQKITTGEWRRRIIKVGADDLVDAANRASAFYEKGSARVWAIGMLEVINKGLRNRLELTENKTEESV